MKTILDLQTALRGNASIEWGPDGCRGFIWQRMRPFCVVMSFGGGWDHVSISTQNEKALPTWDDMCFFRDLFFRPDEVVMQLHPAEGVKVNTKRNCLHLWRPQGQEIPTPPICFV